MSRKHVQFRAITVDCSEAMDWEIVRVTFDTEAPDFDEENRTSPYLSISANFEFGDDVQLEFHDESDYNGDSLRKFDLWRSKAIAVSRRGYEFDITFDISENSFRELREFLKVLLRSDCFREENQQNKTQ